MKSVHSRPQPLDSRQLRAFVTLAKSGSFTKTGEELFLSQSAISHSMKALESDIGCRLFDRVGKKAQLTPSGEHFLHHAERILREMSVARESIQQRSTWGQGRFRVGASLNACQFILPKVLPALKKDFPQTPVTIEACNVMEALELLDRDRIDVALVIEPLAQHEHRFDPAFQDELLLVLSPTHPWAKTSGSARGDLAEEKLLVYRRNTLTFQLIEEYLRREQVAFQTVIEFASLEVIKEFVKLQIGVAILPKWVVRAEVESGELVIRPLGKRRLRRTWGLLQLKTRANTLIEETFARLCTQAAESFAVSN